MPHRPARRSSRASRRAAGVRGPQPGHHRGRAGLPTHLSRLLSCHITPYSLCHRLFLERWKRMVTRLILFSLLSCRMTAILTPSLASCLVCEHMEASVMPRMHSDGLCAQGGIGDAVLHLLKLAGQGTAHPALSELSPAGAASLLQVPFYALPFEPSLGGIKTSISNFQALPCTHVLSSSLAHRMCCGAVGRAALYSAQSRCIFSVLLLCTALTL